MASVSCVRGHHSQERTLHFQKVLMVGYARVKLDPSISNYINLGCLPPKKVRLYRKRWRKTGKFILEEFNIIWEYIYVTKWKLLSGNLACQTPWRETFSTPPWSQCCCTDVNLVTPRCWEPSSTSSGTILFRTKNCMAASLKFQWRYSAEGWYWPPWLLNDFIMTYSMTKLVDRWRRVAGWGQT